MKVALCLIAAVSVFCSVAAASITSDRYSQTVDNVHVTAFAIKTTDSFTHDCVLAHGSNGGVSVTCNWATGR